MLANIQPLDFLFGGNADANGGIQEWPHCCTQGNSKATNSQPPDHWYSNWVKSLLQSTPFTKKC